MERSIIDKVANFKERNSLSNSVIVKMVTEYANSEPDLACTYLSEKYKISKSTFYKARDYAIICCLVDNHICKRVKNKSVNNYKSNNSKKSGRKSLTHFEELYLQIRQRNKKYLLDCNEKEIDFLKMQIDCYDLYVCIIKESVNLEDLEKNLSNAIKRREKSWKYIKIYVKIKK